MTFRISVAGANAALDAATALLDASGNALVDLLDSSGNVICTNTMAATSFLAAAAGSVSADTITDASGNQTDTAASFVLKTGGGTAVFDGACGTSGSGAECIMNSTSVTLNQPVQINSITLTVANLIP